MAINTAKYLCHQRFYTYPPEPVDLTVHAILYFLRVFLCFQRSNNRTHELCYKKYTPPQRRNRVLTHPPTTRHARLFSMKSRDEWESLFAHLLCTKYPPPPPPDTPEKPLDLLDILDILDILDYCDACKILESVSVLAIPPVAVVHRKDTRLYYTRYGLVGVLFFVFFAVCLLFNSLWWPS